LAKCKKDNTLKMKKQLLMVMGFVLTTNLMAQMDTIYSNSEKIACTVKEISSKVVKYSYPGEKVRISLNKNDIKRIVFKSGRVQFFSEDQSFKSISNLDDYESVSITHSKSELDGLFKLGDVECIAKGRTSVDNKEEVKLVAFSKMKMIAAMMGADVIHMSYQDTKDNVKGTQFSPGYPTETMLAGDVYAKVIPSFLEFKKSLEGKSNFLAVEEAQFLINSEKFDRRDIEKEFSIKNITNEKGIIEIEGSLKGLRRISNFRLVSYDEDSFHIYYEKKNSVHNITVKL